MPGLIHGREFEASADRLREQHPRAEEAIEAILWLLTRTASFEEFEFVAEGRTGPVYAVHSERSAVVPSVTVLFGFEHNGGERKVLLIEVKLTEADEEDPTQR